MRYVTWLVAVPLVLLAVYASANAAVLALIFGERLGDIWPPDA